MDINQKLFWMTFREGILLILDGLERFLDIRPRTSEIRALLRQEAKRSKMTVVEFCAPESTNLS